MYPESKKTMRGSKTQERILDAAHRLFLKHGYHGTSMRQISAESNVALGGLYNHFVGKEALFVAVLEAYHPFHEIFPALTEAEGESVEEFLHNAAKSVVDTLDRRPDFLNLMFIEIVEFGSQHIPGLVSTFLPRVIALVTPLTEKAGRLRPIPLPLVIRAFLGLIFSYFMSRLILEGSIESAPEDRARMHFVDIFLHGILAEG